MRRLLRGALGWLLLAVLLLSPTAGLASGSGPWVTPLELDFGPVGVGVAAPQQVVTITNTGQTPLTNFAGGAVSAPFNASQDCVIAGGIPPGGHCHYDFDFKPTTPGAFTATSSSSTNAGPITVVVHGQGVGADVVANPAGLDFGSVRVGGTAATQIVTIHNAGLVPLTAFAGGAVNAPFNASQDCVIPGGIPPGGSCHYYFTFSPTTSGSFSATSSSVINGVSVNISVRGSGRVPLLASGQYVTPFALDFGPVGLGQTAPQQIVTITNQSTLFALTGFAGGGVPAPFNATQDCAPMVPPGGKCHYYFTFSPTSAGVFTASSDSTDSVGPFSIALRGTGVGAGVTVTPLSLDFGPQLLHSTHQQVVTIRNTGMAPLDAFAGGAVSAPFNASQDCVIAGGIPPGGSCHYYFTFSPTTIGSYTATSSSVINGHSVNIAVRGTGLATTYVYLPLILGSK